MQNLAELFAKFRKSSYFCSDKRDCNIFDVMENRQEETYKRIHFAVMAIEASARKANLSGKEMHDRLKRQGLIHKRLLRHYEQLHTQSLEWVVDDTIETLHNWEQEEKEAGLC